MRCKRSAILTYHSIDDSGSIISVSPRRFRSQMNFLADHNIRVVPLGEIQSNPGAVALTFDDGFRNFHEHVFPVLREYRLPATVFIVSGYSGRKNDWPSQPASAIPCLELMNWREIRQVAESGILLGAHTVSHPRLTAIPVADREREFRDCQAALEDHAGAAVDAIAYPYGDYDMEVCRQASRFFRVACTTNLDFTRAEDSPLALPRLDMYYLQNPFWFEKVLTATGGAYVAVRRALRRMRGTLN